MPSVDPHASERVHELGRSYESLPLTGQTFVRRVLNETENTHAIRIHQVGGIEIIPSGPTADPDVVDIAAELECSCNALRVYDGTPAIEYTCNE